MCAKFKKRQERRNTWRWKTHVKITIAIDLSAFCVGSKHDWETGVSSQDSDYMWRLSICAYSNQQKNTWTHTLSQKDFTFLRFSAVAVDTAGDLPFQIRKKELKKWTEKPAGTIFESKTEHMDRNQ